MKIRLSAIFASCLLVLTAIIPGYARLQVNVSGGNFNPIPIAITNFAANSLIGQQMAAVISADLERSGLFKPLDESLFLERVQPDEQPRFSDWQQIDAQGLVTGRVTQENDGHLHVAFRLWDTTIGSQIDARQLDATPQSWRRVAHIIADAIYTKMTGETAYFESRVVFVDETGPQKAPIKRLAMMDQDGANVSYLTDGSELVLTPRFSPNRQEITYMTFAQGIPRVYWQKLDTGEREVVGNFPNMSIAPRFSPDGDQIIMSLLEDDGSANLYTMNLRSRAISRLTSTPAIDTSASFSPDGRKVVFSSDRDGRPQLYIMNTDGSALKRISFSEGSYATPVWSPRGDYIAFTHQGPRQFSIGVMKPDGTDERLLASGFHNEGPTWSPNGRVIMFFRQNMEQGARMFSIDLTGRNERLVASPHGASDPAWSPLLK